MRLSQKHIDFENSCKQIIGSKILKVEYAEIDYNKYGAGNSEPAFYTGYNDIHSVDFSVFIHTTINDVLEIRWDGQFFQFGIGVKFNAPSGLSGFRIWDVSNNDVWVNYISLEIVDIKIGWDLINNSLLYPQDITLYLSDNKKMFISAAQLHEDGAASGFSDNLLITNNEQLAKDLHIIAS